MFDKTRKMREQLAEQRLLNEETQQANIIEVEKAMESADFSEADQKVNMDQRIEERMQGALLRCDTEIILFGTYRDLLLFVDSIPNYTMEDPLGFHSYPMEDGSPYLGGKMVSSVNVRVPRGAVETLYKKHDLQAIAWYAQAVDFQGQLHGIIAGNTEVMPVDPDSVRKALLAVGW